MNATPQPSYPDSLGLAVEWGPARAIQRVVVGSRLLGQFERPTSWRPEADGGWCTGRPSVYVCPVCTRTWAVADWIIPQDQTFEVVPARCDIHGDGSLLWRVGPWLLDPALLVFGPRALIEREFRIALSQVKE